MKQVLNYACWVLLSFLIGIGYVRIIVGAKSKKLDGIFIYDLLYDFTYLYAVPVIGGIIAMLFIIIDYFYLKRKFKSTQASTMIRFLLLLIIVIGVGIIHYFLEKVIDII